MNRRTVLATIVAMFATPTVALLAMPAGALAARGPAVTMRVEGLSSTLLPAKVVRPGSGWITRHGAPRGDCSEKSAQGALNVATHGRWNGPWTTENGPEYEVMSILGETHNWLHETKYYWEIFTDNAPAATGACELALHRGEQLLFAAVPQTGNAFTTAIRAPREVAAGHSFDVKVVWFNGSGRAKPLPGARVSDGTSSATTNARGIAMLPAVQAGTLVLQARHAWSSSTAYVRAAAVTVRVS